MKTQKRKNSNSKKYFTADVYNKESGPLEIAELETPSEKWSTPVDAVLYLAGSKCQNVEVDDTYSGEISDFVDARSVETDSELSNDNESDNYNRESNKSNYKNTQLKTKSDSNHSKHLSTLSSKFAQELKLKYATNAANNLHYQNNKTIRDTFYNMDYIHSQFTTFNPNYLNFRYRHFYPNYPVITHSEYYPSTYQPRCSPNCLNQFRNCTYCMPKVYPMNYEVCNKPENMYSRNSDGYFNKSVQNHQRYSDTHFGGSQNNTSGSNYSTSVNYSKWEDNTPRSSENYKDAKYFFDKYYYRVDDYQDEKETGSREYRYDEEDKFDYKRLDLGKRRYTNRNDILKRLEKYKEKEYIEDNIYENKEYKQNRYQEENKEKEMRSEQNEFNKYLEVYKGYDQKEADYSSTMLRDGEIQSAIEKAVRNALESYLSPNKLSKGDETCLTDPVNRQFTFDKNDATLTNQEQEQMYSTNYSDSMNLSQYGREQVEYNDYSLQNESKTNFKQPTVSFDMENRNKRGEERREYKQYRYQKEQEYTNKNNMSMEYRYQEEQEYKRDEEKDSLNLSQYSYKDDKNYESVVFDLKKLADEIQKESLYLDSTLLEKENKKQNLLNEQERRKGKEGTDENKEYKQNRYQEENKRDEENDDEDRSENLVGSRLFDSQVSNEYEDKEYRYQENKEKREEENKENTNTMNSKQFDFESNLANRGYVEVGVDESVSELRESVGRSGLVGGGLFDEENRERRELELRRYRYQENKNNNNMSMEYRYQEEQELFDEKRLEYERENIYSEMNSKNNLLDDQMTNRDDEMDLSGSEYGMENEFEQVLNDLDDEDYRDSAFETRDYEYMNRSNSREGKYNKEGYSDTNYYTSSSFNLNTFNSFSLLKENNRKFDFENAEVENDNINGTTLSTSDLMESRNYYRQQGENKEYKQNRYGEEQENKRNQENDDVSVDLVNNPFGKTNPFYQKSEKEYIENNKKENERNKNREMKMVYEVLDSNSELSSYKSQPKNDDGVSLILDKVNRLEASLRKVESRLNNKIEDSYKSERNTELYEGSPIKSPTTMTPAGVNQISDVELMEGYKAASLIKKLLHVKSMESLVPAFTAFLQNRRV